jgi:hypothetical protein
MARFFGEIGFGETTKTGAGVFEDVITERSYRGDVVRNTRSLEPGDKVNSDISVDNSISIIADQYANEHIFAIRYVRWAGSLWNVPNVEVQRPRLILRLGGVYNGPRAVEEGTTPSTP